MKKFRAHAYMTTHLVLDIEAENFEDADRIARESDGGNFKELEDEGSWDLDEIEEITDDV